MFRCGDGSCIFYEFVCNNITECPDSSDETVCGKRFITEWPFSFFDDALLGYFVKPTA